MKIFRGGSEKIVGLGRGAKKIYILQNQQQGGTPKSLTTSNEGC